MRIRLIAITLAAFPVGAEAAAANCADGPAPAARANAASFDTLDWAPFRRPERGWAIYAVRISAEIDTRCAADTPGFAAALARWQAARALPATGIVDASGFAVMNAGWTAARPFVAATRDGNCPAPPADDALAPAAADESYGGKAIVLHRAALAAYRRLRAAARREIAVSDPNWFRLFSGYRAPVDDDLRCATEGNCNGIVRASCSAHRTGLALDLHVGHVPGLGPDSSDDANRRAMVRTLAYRWLVTNAARFGFANYVFEPWHWEYGPPPRSAAPSSPRTPSTRPRLPGKTPP